MGRVDRAMRDVSTSLLALVLEHFVAPWAAR
jgi:hypothetical protein